ncbi:hypothetical protein AVEN_9141-1 [Araneus ventricosus]|uniref:Secreted protein n=1 Tax=Araneus ventricosus TaxID=182803 RepID=A0A4Y2UFF4_ARAVE|nr:hypothetical protein AVEN_9141-1 [Araneus ventricosus]
MFMFVLVIVKELTCALRGCALPWNSMVPKASVGLGAVCREGLQCSSAEACEEAWLWTLCARYRPCVALAGWLDSMPPQQHLERKGRRMSQQ